MPPTASASPRTADLTTTSSKRFVARDDLESVVAPEVNDQLRRRCLGVRVTSCARDGQFGIKLTFEHPAGTKLSEAREHVRAALVTVASTWNGRHAAPTLSSSMQVTRVNDPFAVHSVVDLSGRP